MDPAGSSSLTIYRPSNVNKTKTPLSNNNKSVLMGHLVNQCGPDFKEATLKTSDSGFLAMIFSYFPSSNTTGKLAGFAIAQTHGADITNGLVCRVADLLFPKPQMALTYGESFFNAFSGVAKPTLSETAKIMITPKVLPYIAMACQGVGGLVFPAAVSLTMLIINRVLSDPNSKYTPEKLPDLDQLITVKDGRYIDANGNALTERDLKDIRVAVNRYDFICKLLAADQEDVEAIFSDYLKVKPTHSDEPLNLEFADGKPVSKKEFQKIIIAFERLKSQNYTNQGMWDVIQFFSEHLPVPAAPVLEKPEDNWLIMQ
jgi:hypothetical protein